MATIQEYLGVPSSWPVVERVKHEIVLMPTKQDVKGARKHDPRACALHNAACRMFDIPNCAIGGRWAYIPQRDSKGKPYIARMQATAETQRAIKVFDKTGEIPLGGFRFIQVAHSHLMKTKRAYNKRWYRGEIGGTGAKRKMTKQRRKPLRAIPRSFNAGEAA